MWKSPGSTSVPSFLPRPRLLSHLIPVAHKCSEDKVLSVGWPGWSGECTGEALLWPGLASFSQWLATTVCSAMPVSLLVDFLFVFTIFFEIEETFSHWIKFGFSLMELLTSKLPQLEADYLSPKLFCAKRPGSKIDFPGSHLFPDH